MNIANLPTDNLYKFIAIFGLIIFMTSIIYPFSKINIYAQQKIIVLAELNKLKLESSYLEEEAKEAKSTRNEKLNHALELKKNLIVLEKKLIDFGANMQLYDFLVSELKFLLYAGYVGAFIGALLIIIGFGAWKNKVQKYQDIILKNEAEKNSKKGAGGINF